MAKSLTDSRLSLEDGYWAYSGKQHVMLRNGANGGVEVGSGPTMDDALRMAKKELRRLLNELERLE
jgi:hypothetical protein